MYIVLLRISNLFCYFVSFQIYFLCWIMYGMFALVAGYERVELDYQKSRTLVMLLIEIMQKPSPVLGKINPLSLCLYDNDISSFGWTRLIIFVWPHMMKYSFVYRLFVDKSIVMRMHCRCLPIRLNNKHSFIPSQRDLIYDKDRRLQSFVCLHFQSSTNFYERLDIFLWNQALSLVTIVIKDITIIVCMRLSAHLSVVGMKFCLLEVKLQNLS